VAGNMLLPSSIYNNIRNSPRSIGISVSLLSNGKISPQADSNIEETEEITIISMINEMTILNLYKMNVIKIKHGLPNLRY